MLAQSRDRKPRPSKVTDDLGYAISQAAPADMLGLLEERSWPA